MLNLSKPGALFEIKDKVLASESYEDFLKKEKLGFLLKQEGVRREYESVKTHQRFFPRILMMPKVTKLSHIITSVEPHMRRFNAPPPAKGRFFISQHHCGKKIFPDPPIVKPGVWPEIYGIPTPEFVKTFEHIIGPIYRCFEGREEGSGGIRSFELHDWSENGKAAWLVTVVFGQICGVEHVALVYEV